SGPVTLTAKTTGENRVELDLSGGTRIEDQSAVTADRTCSWSGKDGVVSEQSLLGLLGRGDTPSSRRCGGAELAVAVPKIGR
ncbi:MAG TPA: hypothetical protein VK638_09305, partial [Edaphobacter sp.]|nr:hypothetical protein [Edaphobacter sp.]